MIDLLKNRKAVDVIARKFLLQGELRFNEWLFDGKMESIIFCYEYANQFSKPLYKEFANELIDDLFLHIDLEEDISFSKGLFGIAWGILYLFHQGYVAGEMDDILVDFDNVIMQKDPRRYPNDSFDLGFEGVLYYINTRLRFAYEYQLKKPFDAVYLSDIQYALKHQIYSEMEYNQDKIFCQCMEYGMGNPDFELGYLQLPFVKCIMA